MPSHIMQISYGVTVAVYSSRKSMKISQFCIYLADGLSRRTEAHEIPRGTTVPQTESVLIANPPGLRVVDLNRPKALNALDGEMIATLLDRVEALGVEMAALREGAAAAPGLAVEREGPLPLIDTYSAI